MVEGEALAACRVTGSMKNCTVLHVGLEMSLLKKTNRSDIRNDFSKRAVRFWHGLPREQWGHCPQRCFRSVEIWP